MLKRGFSENIFVLIETLWNVKNFQAPDKRNGWIRINRNIVECKGGNRHSHFLD